TRSKRDWSSDVCSSDLEDPGTEAPVVLAAIHVEDEGALELRLDEDHDMVPSLGENMRRCSKEAGGDRPSRTHGRKSAVTVLALEIGRASCRERGWGVVV